MIILQYFFLIFRAELGSQQIEGQVQRLPMYLRPPYMNILPHHQYPSSEWYTLKSHEPTLKSTVDVRVYASCYIVSVFEQKYKNILLL